MHIFAFMSTPSDISRLCLMQSTRRAARAITRRYDAALSRFDLTGGQFSILVAAKAMGGATVSRLAEGLGLDRTTLTRNLRPLEQRGLLASGPSKKDARVRVIYLTDAGATVLNQAIPAWAAAQDSLIKANPKVDWEALRDSLKSIKE